MFKTILILGGLAVSSVASAQSMANYQMNPQEQAAADQLKANGTMSQPVCMQVTQGTQTTMVCVETDPQYLPKSIGGTPN